MSGQANGSLTDAQRFIRAAFGDGDLLDEYMLKAFGDGTPASSDDMTAWFESKGYNTTLSQVQDEWKQETNNTLDFYDGTYNTYLNGRVGPTLSINGGVVTINDVAIVAPIFSMSKLSWTSDQNSSSGSINLMVFDSPILQADGTDVPEDADIFIGAQFEGTYRTTGAEPAANNFYGRQGVFPADFIAELVAAAAAPASTAAPTLPLTSSSLSQWADTYSIYAPDAAGKWPQTNDTVVIASDGTITYNNTTINNPTFGSQLLTWSTDDNNPCNFLVVMKRVDHATPAQPWTGNQFVGKRWAAGEQTPASVNVLGVIGASPSADAARDAGTQAGSSADAAQGYSFTVQLMQMALSMVVAHYMIEGLNGMGKLAKLGASKLWDKLKSSGEKSSEVAKPEDKALEKALEGGKNSVEKEGEGEGQGAKPADPDPEAEAKELNREAGADNVAGKAAANDLAGQGDKLEGKMAADGDGEGVGVGEGIKGKQVGEPVIEARPVEIIP